MTKFELISKDKTTGRYTFLLKNSTPAMANAIRRSCLELVPTMAIDTIEFARNSGALYDELIAHRLGLLPLKTDLKSYTAQDECKCGGEGCQSCTLKLTMTVKGPNTVYAENLKSQDPKVVPVYPRTPITRLTKGQDITLIATAKLGSGSEHSKFSPGHVWYTYKPKLKINNNHPQFEKFKDKFPPGAFKGKKLNAGEIEKNNLFDACEGVNKEIVDITYDNENFIMHVEPWGQLTPKQMLVQALKQLSDQVTLIQEKLT